ncbi:uncharacterized protein LAESUDRAFT_718437 [Laetiporus sulphureus 93-53]|uniref:Uncharacterized protein n=1 Tax=Laetiporus sulphureus 93-53 TaxID=1314785 RepID=A0A165AYS8_9APHY|nr:uncharacterized protein LAESUDRAFT_718437 [Laetiporus sulphureus 93-53]KZS99910.1 hypothetical protein LAESUDRAFT_718437 [Laetiporus sulphureus 93-53]
MANPFLPGTSVKCYFSSYLLTKAEVEEQDHRHDEESRLITHGRLLLKERIQVSKGYPERPPGHVFCHHCLTQHLYNSNVETEPTCPECTSVVDIQSMKDPMIAVEIMRLCTLADSRYILNECHKLLLKQCDMNTQLLNDLEHEIEDGKGWKKAAEHGRDEMYKLTEKYREQRLQLQR